MKVSIEMPNAWDQRAAGVDIDLTENRSTAAPLHPFVRRFICIELCENVSRCEAPILQRCH
jgi:hypothetical protein